MSTATLPALDDVIGWIESRNNDKALRLEPLVLAHDRYANVPVLQAIRAANLCDDATAKMIAATSWGRFQLMGFNLYSSPLFYRGSVADYFGDDSRQTEMFYDFLAEKNIDYTVSDLANNKTKREHFALTYNGSIRYAENIIESLQHYGVPYAIS